MYELTVTAEFAAAHAIVIAGERESIHGHNWRVTATVAGPRVDGDGLLCDFHLVESCLRDAVAPFHNRHLNETPPFDRTNPTAERVAVHLAERLIAALSGRLPAGAAVMRVSVTEAAGCEAAYRPPPRAQGV